MYYIITKENNQLVVIWFRGVFADLRQRVQYIIDGSNDPAAYTILLEDRKEMPLPSFAEIFHIKKRSLDERLNDD